MQDREQISVTEALGRWNSGDRGSLDQLLPLIERELHAIASRQMRRERPNHTLQATALVNEAYLRLVGLSQVNWQGRGHFIAIAARLMRQILVDHARGIRREKRGGGEPLASFEDSLVYGAAHAASLTALDNALHDLERIDPRKVQIVEMRYFGGLSVEETADVLKVHPNTVIRDWAFTKAWLRKQLDART